MIYQMFDLVFLFNHIVKCVSINKSIYKMNSLGVIDMLI
jgi:hypothetical protein